MNTEVKVTGNPKPFGIIGLVIAIFSCIFSFIPCVGTYAIGPAILALIFCTVAFVSLKSLQQPKSIPLAGIIVSIVAISIGTYQYIRYQNVFEAKKELEQTIDREFNRQVIKTLDTAAQQKIKKDSVNATQKDSVHW